MLAGLGSGCAALCPQRPPQSRTQQGEVSICYPACRHLSVVGHSCQRAEGGRLSVSVRFRNLCKGRYAARLTVRFCDANGREEASAPDVGPHRFDPGETSVEWISYGRAGSYVVEVRSAGKLPW